MLFYYLLFFSKDGTFNKSFNFSSISFDIFMNGQIGNKRIIEEILFEIEIPSIGLNEEVYTMDSMLNDVNQHVQILEPSNLDKHFILLAAHSGNSKVSYFNSLINLEIGDMIQIKTPNCNLFFVIEEISYIPKTGYVELFDDVMKDRLFLITCSLDYEGMQLVVNSSLVYF